MKQLHGIRRRNLAQISNTIIAHKNREHPSEIHRELELHDISQKFEFFFLSFCFIAVLSNVLPNLRFIHIYVSSRYYCPLNILVLLNLFAQSQSLSVVWIFNEEFGIRKISRYF